MPLYPFSQIASNITVRVEPGDTDLERYVGLEHLDPESLKLRRWGSPSDVIGQKLRFWKGDIIYGKRRAYQRKLAVADFDGICSAHAMVLRAKQDVILPELLPFFLQSEIFHQRAVEISVGSLSPTINWSTLAKQEFMLPPLDEQRRIADLLWAADDVQVQYLAVYEKIERLKSSYLNEIFSTNKTDAQTYGEFTIPNHWKLLSLPDLVVKKPNSLTAGPFGTIFKAKDFRPEGIPILQIRHITKNGFKFDDRLTFMDIDVYERIHKPYTAYPGDLLIAKMGEPPGTAGIYPIDSPVAMVTPDVIKATLDPTVVLPEFAVNVFNNRAVAHVLKLCKGGTRTRVSLGEFYKLLWPIPPIEEQQQFLNLLNPIEDIKGELQNQTKLLHTIKTKYLESLGV